MTFGFETPNADCGLTDEQIHAALDWLEGNPPQEILFPRVISAGNKAVAYRNKGNVQDRKKPKDKKSPAAAYIATAYKQHPESGMVLTWVWHENPSSEIARTLSSLCGEVPYLGEACSVVELRTHEDYGFPVDAGYDANPFIRANCFLSETGKPTVVLNKRYGEKEELEPLTVDLTEKLLETAYAQAHEKAGITWEGQEFLVQGNPAVLANSSAEDDAKEN